MNPFNWLRKKCAEAVVLGVSDGLAAVTPDGDETPDLGELRQRLAEALTPRALPAAEERAAKRKGGAA